MPWEVVDGVSLNQLLFWTPTHRDTERFDPMRCSSSPMVLAYSFMPVTLEFFSIHCFISEVGKSYNVLVLGERRALNTGLNTGLEGNYL